MTNNQAPKKHQAPMTNKQHSFEPRITRMGADEDLEFKISDLFGKAVLND